jgi:hypothetical protein
MMTTMRSEVVMVTGFRRWRDADGRKRQMTKKFWQSINPWNCGADGRPKTREDILREVQADRDKWEAEV